MLTNLSKTNAFYRCPSIISKSIFFVDSQHPLSPYSMLQYASWTLWPGYNIEKGRGGRNVKIRHWKTHAFNETGLFRGVSQLLLSMIVASSSHTGEYWPSVVFVWTSLRSVCTATTLGHHSPVKPTWMISLHTSFPLFTPPLQLTSKDRDAQ